MYQCTIQQKSSFENIKETVVCPKPRRLGLIHATLFEPAPVSVRPLWWHVSHQQEGSDVKAEEGLLSIIHSKDGFGADQSFAHIASSSPPFFSGSPPSRVSNPLIQDSRFGDERFTTVSPRSIPTPFGLAPSSASTRKGCARANFGNNPAVRVEGFDCLDRDRRNGGIPGLA